MTLMPCSIYRWRIGTFLTYNNVVIYILVYAPCIHTHHTNPNTYTTHTYIACKLDVLYNNGSRKFVEKHIQPFLWTVRITRSPSCCTHLLYWTDGMIWCGYYVEKWLSLYSYGISQKPYKRIRTLWRHETKCENTAKFKNHFLSHFLHFCDVPEKKNI